MTSNAIETKRKTERPYGLVGILAAVAIATLVLLAYFGVTGLGLFTAGSAMFALGMIAIVMAAGLGYVLFTLRGSLRAMMTNGRNVEARLQRLENPLAPARGVMAATVTVTPATTIRVSTWTPLPPRKGEHATRARAASVVDIEGIGPEYSARLREQGVRTIGDLKAADPAVLAPAIRVNVETFRQWQSMADMMELDQVGKQYSELLVRSGVASVDELATLDATRLLERIDSAQATTKDGSARQGVIQASHVKLARVEEWIVEAKRIA